MPIPYLFDFLGLKNDYLENDLETAILRDLEGFILEFGKGFAFVERQKRMIIDGEDFYLPNLGSASPVTLQRGMDRHGSCMYCAVISCMLHCNARSRHAPG